MHAFLAVVGCIALVIGIDWLATTSAGGKAWSFDYRYWPMSKSRMASVVLLAVAVTAMGLFMKPDPDNPPMWWLFVIGPPLVIWFAVFWADFIAQRRKGYREPSPYGYGSEVVETASDFLKRRAGKARPEDMLPFLDKAKRETPPTGDEI